MATHEEITAALQSFCEGYQSNKKLKQMNKDWNRIITVEASDLDSLHRIILADGELSFVAGAAVAGTELEGPDLAVTSDSETLTDLFYGDITPTEPYLNGSLTIRGSEEDIIRLDIISLMIWGE